MLKESRTYVLHRIALCYIVLCYTVLYCMVWYDTHVGCVHAEGVEEILRLLHHHGREDQVPAQ